MLSFSFKIHLIVLPGRLKRPRYGPSLSVCQSVCPV